MALLEEVRKGHAYCVGGHANETAHLNFISHMAQHAVPYRVDSVYEYFEQRSRTQPKVLINDAYMAPLAGSCWFEFAESADTYGVLIAYDDLLNTSQRDQWSKLVTHALTRETPVAMESVRWFAQAFPCVRYPGAYPMILPSMTFFLGEDGSVIDFRLEIPRADLPQNAIDTVEHVSRFTVAVATTAIRFAHCKNVTISDVPIPRQQRRAAERSGTPLTTYKTLTIDPSHAVVRHEQDRRARGEAGAMPLHIVRGHFATYSPDKPLFGKYSGTYFVPMHTRGNLEHGKVQKDYKVKAVAS